VNHVRLLRGLAGVLLWVVSLLLILIAAILCVTLILLPLGIPLMGYARRTFTLSLKLMLPRAVSHPVDTADKAMAKRSRRARKRAKKQAALTAKDAGRLSRRGRKQMKRLAKA